MDHGRCRVAEVPTDVAELETLRRGLCRRVGLKVSDVSGVGVGGGGHTADVSQGMDPRVYAVGLSRWRREGGPEREVGGRQGTEQRRAKRQAQCRSAWIKTPRP